MKLAKATKGHQNLQTQKAAAKASYKLYYGCSPPLVTAWDAVEGRGPVCPYESAISMVERRERNHNAAGIRTYLVAKRPARRPGRLESTETYSKKRSQVQTSPCLSFSGSCAGCFFFLCCSKTSYGPPDLPQLLRRKYVSSL